MKALEKAIRGKRNLVFFDLEGTGTAHEIIEIGAFNVSLHEDFSVKGISKGFTTYVKAHSPIGPVVTRLTGIDEETLKRKGVLFPAAWKAFEKFVGKNKGKCTYVAFGNQDLKIIENSIYFNGDYGVDFAREIHKNFLDFSAFVSIYVKDPNNNPLSLTNYLKLFGVPFEGQAHDAMSDAYNLVSLYNAFLSKHEIVESEYQKVLSRLSHLPSPIQKVLRKLNNGESVTPADYEKAIEEALK